MVQTDGINFGMYYQTPFEWYITSLPKLKISWRWGKQYISPVTGRHNKTRYHIDPPKETNLNVDFSSSAQVKIGTSQNSISNFLEGKKSNFWFPCCSTREDLSTDVLITTNCRTDIDEAKVISALWHKSKFNFEFKKKVTLQLTWDKICPWV